MNKPRWFEAKANAAGVKAFPGCGDFYYVRKSDVAGQVLVYNGHSMSSIISTDEARILFALGAPATQQAQIEDRYDYYLHI